MMTTGSLFVLTAFDEPDPLNDVNSFHLGAHGSWKSIFKSGAC